ncbi:MAG: hypothetical protein DU480_10835 [Nitrosomonas sp.]|uniref:hypothetical protein n=1 Tax=Nitrosomonas sp. TaxID=42353 RepID=UPI0032ED25D5
MRMLQGLVLAFFSCLAHSNAYAISIVYQGFECLSAVNTEDPAPNNGTPVQSRFEVIEDSGDGIYRLNLTGGIPRFVSNDRTVCIDKTTAIGYSGIPDDVLPQPLDAIDATGYFDGEELIIVISSLYTDLSARRNPFSSFTTSFIFPFTNTLIFKFNSTTSSFRLKKVVRNRGFVHTSGSTNSITPFFETVLPSFNKEAQDKPVILTPLSTIEYKLEK